MRRAGHGIQVLVLTWTRAVSALAECVPRWMHVPPGKAPSGLMRSREQRFPARC